MIGVRSPGLARTVEPPSLPNLAGQRAHDIFPDRFYQGVPMRSAGDSLVLASPYIVEPAQIEQMVGMLAASIKKHV